jgi:hypothetical protein
MSEAQHPPRIGRSVLAVMAGFVVVVVLSLLTDIFLYKAGAIPTPGQRMSDSMLLVASIYRTAYAVVGSYISDRLAPYEPMVHALIGGFIGLVLSIVGVVVSWNHVSTMGPRWYPISLVITALPAAWLGGKFRVMQLRTQPTNK